VSKKVFLPYRDLDRAKPYVRALAAAGVEVCLADVSGAVCFEDCSGLLLMGGTDVDPRLYGQSPAPQTQRPDGTRDNFESLAIDEALKRDLPILAICRGLQILNVHLGGSLVQHLDSVDRHRQKTPEDPGRAAHVITIEPNTLLAEIAGVQTWQVNSRHHQAIDGVGRELRISARAPDDGTIEAVEIPSRRFVLGVQWHPEDQAPNNAEQMKLFQCFAEAL
jgi:putative glutamine amidotransferase